MANVTPPLIYLIIRSLMPELPEVETFARFFNQHGLHQPIRHVEIFHPKILENCTAEQIQSTLHGNVFSHTYRRGKYLFIALQPSVLKPQIPPEALPAPEALPWILLHFGMTGYLSYTQAGHTWYNAYGDPTRPEAHVRVRFTFQSGDYLDFHEQRLFGKIALVHNPEQYLQAHQVGPDALSISETEFLARLASKKGPLKAILLNQSLVAGIGNVYADEILFQCGLNPTCSNIHLSPTQQHCLYRQMEEVLQTTVNVSAARDQLPAGYMLHTRHPKGHCPRCHRVWDTASIGGRTTYFCPHCQPGGTF